MAGLIATSPAHAEFRLCNETQHNAGVALAHSQEGTWLSEGWWIIEPHECATLASGPLRARYYYLHAIDLADGSGWVGDRYFCTTQRSFSIAGRDTCAERGYERTGFLEIDTSDSAVDYTHVLTDKRH